MTVASTLSDIDLPSASETTRRLGRIALVTQGILYALVGLIAARVAAGDHGAKPSQKGAIASVARQPFGRALLVALTVGLVAHALWRLALAVRGEPGDDEDGSSVAKRAANVCRAAVYAGFTVAALRVLFDADEGSGGQPHKRGTAHVLEWPGGRILVALAGLAIIGAGVWNLWKGVSRSFVDKLDLSTLDSGPRRMVEVVGVAGYVARFTVFCLVGGFLVQAALDHNPGEARTLDQSLRAVAEAPHGPVLLLALAIGLVLFGAFRVLDGWYRRPNEITHA